MQALGIISPEQAIERLEKLTCLLRQQLSTQKDKTYFTPLVSYCAALNVQSQALRCFNEFVEVGVPWDEELNLPSSPSMAADIKTYSEQIGLKGELKGLFSSFSGWALFRRVVESCACGWIKKRGGGLMFRDVSIDIMVNTIIKTEEGGNLKIKQFIGVRADDAEHLAHHYEIFSRQSSAVGDLMIILESENCLKFSRDRIGVEAIDLKKAKNFDLDAFSSILSDFLNLTIVGI